MILASTSRKRSSSSFSSHRASRSRPAKSRMSMFNLGLYSSVVPSVRAHFNHFLTMSFSLTLSPHLLRFHRLFTIVPSLFSLFSFALLICPFTFLENRIVSSAKFHHVCKRNFFFFLFFLFGTKNPTMTNVMTNFFAICTLEQSIPEILDMVSHYPLCIQNVTFFCFLFF